MKMGFLPILWSQPYWTPLCSRESRSACTSSLTRTDLLGASPATLNMPSRRTPRTLPTIECREQARPSPYPCSTWLVRDHDDRAPPPHVPHPPNPPRYAVKYDSYHTSAAEWGHLLKEGGSFSVRGGANDAYMVFLLVEKQHQQYATAGFDGFYTYFASDGFTYGSTTRYWGQLAELAR
mmetsp:Transcript_71547/g.202124  ORF Transcript_71547/g.202124 Transcript_71547/m.202124 type:complete len:179 (-) Transcript_71547:778-1314(-)